MKQRCLNPKNRKYPRYGGRGILICERWMKFENFLEDMGKRPDGMSIERSNNDGNYDPKNCIWATPKQQAMNRSRKLFLEYQGRILRGYQWAEELGIKYSIIRTRLSRGWSVERTLGTKVI